MPENKLKSWERQPKESEPAWQAFSLYRDKGEDRTLISVAEELHKSYTLIRRWATAWQWADRVRDYDNDLLRIAKREAEKGLRNMYLRQTNIAMTVQKKALEALDKLKPDEISQKTIASLLKFGTELERENRKSSVSDQGEDSANMSLADFVVSAYERRKESEEDEQPQ